MGGLTLSTLIEGKISPRPGPELAPGPGPPAGGVVGFVPVALSDRFFLRVAEVSVDLHVADLAGLGLAEQGSAGLGFAGLGFAEQSFAGMKDDCVGFERATLVSFA